MVFENVYEEESVIESSVNIGEVTGSENKPTIINLVEVRKEYEEKTAKTKWLKKLEELEGLTNEQQ